LRAAWRRRIEVENFCLFENETDLWATAVIEGRADLPAAKIRLDPLSGARFRLVVLPH
jgi:hypothetical protein